MTWDSSELIATICIFLMLVIYCKHPVQGMINKYKTSAPPHWLNLVVESQDGSLLCANYTRIIPRLLIPGLYSWPHLLVLFCGFACGVTLGGTTVKNVRRKAKQNCGYRLPLTCSIGSSAQTIYLCEWFICAYLMTGSCPVEVLVIICVDGRCVGLFVHSLMTGDCLSVSFWKRRMTPDLCI